MPIYEYACAKCEREFEAQQRITDEPLKTCPHCRSRRVKRLISLTSFALKGGGWYADGYASNGGSKSSETSDKSDKSDKSETKSDSGKSATPSSSDSSTSKDSSKNPSGGDSKSSAKSKKAVA